MIYNIQIYLIKLLYIQKQYTFNVFKHTLTDGFVTGKKEHHFIYQAVLCRSITRINLLPFSLQRENPSTF